MNALARLELVCGMSGHARGHACRAERARPCCCLVRVAREVAVATYTARHVATRGCKSTQVSPDSTPCAIELIRDAIDDF